jgi:hypothetical protein
MIFIEGVRGGGGGGAGVQASRRAGESERRVFPRAAGAANLNSTPRFRSRTRWWKLQNNRDASLPTLPRHGEPAERALGCPDL